MNEDDARAALAGASGAQARLADRMERCPPWRHVAFGLIPAILIGSATVSTNIQMLGTAIALLLIALIVQDDRRRYGVFVNGYRKGATLPLTLALAGALVVLILAALHAREAGLSAWTKGGLAAIAFALAVGTSIVWQRVFIRELRGKAQ